MLSLLNQRFHKHYRRNKLKLRNIFQKDIELTEYYFGYGANLDIERFAQNNMNATKIGMASLENHKIDFSLRTEFKDKSYAGVSESPNNSVHGLLVKIDKVSLDYLDTLEWCGFGAYERVLKTIKCDDKEYKAWVYVVKYPNPSGIPSTIYLQNMIKTAKNKDFPAGYIAMLEAQEHRSSFEIDHSFSLRTFSCSRKNLKIFLPLYKIHDKIREKLFNLI